MNEAGAIPSGVPFAAAEGQFIHPRALMAIRNLELRARVVVEGFWAGLHRSPYHGFSVEFTEYRQYTPGDDPRYLDWRLYARTDRYYLKKFEDETNLRCHLLTDLSRSMDYGTGGWTKAAYAATLAATLAAFLHQQGDAVGLLTFDERLRDYLPARHRPGHLRHLMLALEKPAGGAATDLAAPLTRIVELVRKRGLMVLLSDLLTPVAQWEQSIASLAACGHEIVVFHLLDPAERDFQFERPILFRDVETGRELFIDPVPARRDYLARFEAHLAAARAACERLGAAFHAMTTDRPLELALFDFVRSRMQTRRLIRRRGRGGAA